MDNPTTQLVFEVMTEEGADIELTPDERDLVYEQMEQKLRLMELDCLGIGPIKLVNVEVS